MGTSTNDVFEIRNEISNTMTLQDANHFVKANIPPSDNDHHDPIEESIKPQYDAYQLKCAYKVIQEEMVEFDDDDDDALILAL